MAAVDWTGVDKTISKGIVPLLVDAFTDGFDNDIKLEYGNKLRLEDSGGDYHDIYISGTTLVIPSTISENRADDATMYFGTGSDVGFNWDGTDFHIIAAADDSIINFGDGTESFDLKVFGNTSSDYIYFDASGNIAYLDGVDLWLKDADILYFGDEKDIQVRWDATDLDILPVADDSVIKFGNGTLSLDLWVYGNTANDNIIFDASANTLSFDGVDIYMEDADNVSFGDSQDVVVQFDATDFTITGASDDLVIKVGNGTNSFDVIWYGETSSNTVTFDASDDKVTFNAVDLYMGDSDHVYLGDSSDVDILFDGTDLKILPGTDEIALKFGSGIVSWNMYWYADAAAKYVYFDVASNQVDFEAVDLHMGDDDVLEFGDATAGDIYMRWDGTDFDILPAADDSVIKFGNGTLSVDIWVYGETADDNIIFDASAKTLSFDGVDVYMEDADNISFGDSHDVVVQFDATDFTITGASDDLVIKVGNGTESFDLYWYGNTANDYVAFDASGNAWSFGQNDHGIDVNFYGAADGVVISWDESGGELDVTATIEMQTASKIQFRDTAVYINSDADASLSLVSDGAIKLNGRVWFHDANTEELSENKTLVVTDYMLQFIDPAGAREVILPAEASSAGLMFIIVNTANAAETITVKDDAGGTVATVAKDYRAICFCDGTTWYGMTCTTS